VTESADETKRISAELQDVEETLRRLRSEQSSPSPDPGDHSDDAADLTNYEEERALIENLEAKRARLSAQLRQSARAAEQ